MGNQDLQRWGWAADKKPPPGSRDRTKYNRGTSVRARVAPEQASHRWQKRKSFAQPYRCGTTARHLDVSLAFYECWTELTPGWNGTGSCRCTSMSGDLGRNGTLDTARPSSPRVAMMSFMTASLQELQQQKTAALSGHLGELRFGSGSVTVVWSRVLVWQGDMCITSSAPGPYPCLVRGPKMGCRTDLFFRRFRAGSKTLNHRHGPAGQRMLSTRRPSHTKAAYVPLSHARAKTIAFMYIHVHKTTCIC
ncbi:hypothetical protein B0I37DRAFT_207976 [Chaetomium sp. MPI-CAGE-AT-0009]|nr:hypothetical protein B0I37DRAFT_207976 [Chaetomium sp. MPI-CAGE-AT-0009]